MNFQIRLQRMHQYLRNYFFPDYHLRFKQSLEVNSVEQLATMADYILEFSSKLNHFSSSMEKLLAKIDTLTHRLENLELEKRLPRFCKRSRSTFRTRESNTSGYCWYHANFGDRAHKCLKLCSFGSGNESRSTCAHHVSIANTHQIVHFFVRDHL